uniref:Uncharacterized protein n=1 Tax=Anguilla anguilla TaxID=7936 RepID=A0A0E9VC77_ANGAN
MAIKHIAGERP